MDGRNERVGRGEMSTSDLRAHFPATGRVEWIGVRAGRRQPVESVQQVRAIRDRGLENDHAARQMGGKRQVTLIQSEHFPVIGALARRSPEPGLLRRNLVVSGINLRALVGQRFQVGAALLEGVGDCAPCRSMEQALGFGGRNAMIGMGGVTARILEGGPIRVGDPVEFYNQSVGESRLI